MSQVQSRPVDTQWSGLALRHRGAQISYHSMSYEAPLRTGSLVMPRTWVRSTDEEAKTHPLYVKNRLLLLLSELLKVIRLEWMKILLGRPGLLHYRLSLPYRSFYQRTTGTTPLFNLASYHAKSDNLTCGIVIWSRPILSNNLRGI